MFSADCLDYVWLRIKRSLHTVDNKEVYCVCPYV